MSVEITALSGVEPEQITWLWPGRVPAGKLVTLDGDPGVGKSTLALTFAATITTGSDWPDGTRCKEPGNVLVMSAEDGLGDTIRPRLEAAGADLDRVHSLDGQRDRDGLLVPIGLHETDHLREAITQTDARLLIVDVMMAFLSDRANAYRDQDMRRILTPLAGLAADTGCTVMLLRHPPKGLQTKAIHAGGGSIGIVGAARVGLLAVADGDERVLTVAKNNLAPALPSLAYRLEAAAIDGAEAVRVQWLGERRESADELVAAIPDVTGDTATVLGFVNGRTLTSVADVTDSFPHISYGNACQVLSRLHARRKIQRVKRGVYSPCQDVSLSGTHHIPRSEYIFETDIETDSQESVRNGVSNPDNETDMSGTVSGTETHTDQSKQDVPDNTDKLTEVDNTHIPPAPGQSSNGTPAGCATIEDAGAEGKKSRICKTPHCGEQAYLKALCKPCYDLEKINNLASGVKARENNRRTIGVKE